MARVNSYVDHDYDRRLEEFKAMKAKLKQQGSDQFSQNQNQAQNNSRNSDSNSQDKNNLDHTKRTFRY